MKPKSAKGLRIAAARLLQRAEMFARKGSTKAYDNAYDKAQTYVNEAEWIEAGAKPDSLEVELDLSPGPIKMEWKCPCCNAVITPIRLPRPRFEFGIKTKKIRSHVLRDDNPFFARDCDRVYTYIVLRRCGLAKGQFYLREYEEGTMVVRTDVPLLLEP